MEKDTSIMLTLLLSKGQPFWLWTHTQTKRGTSSRSSFGSILFYSHPFVTCRKLVHIHALPSLNCSNTLLHKCNWALLSPQLEKMSKLKSLNFFNCFNYLLPYYLSLKLYFQFFSILYFVVVSCFEYSLGGKVGNKYKYR